MSNWKEYRLSYTQRAEEIITGLTLEEKVSLMSGSRSLQEVREAIQQKSRKHYNEEPYGAGGIPEKGIQPLLFVDGSRGVVCGRGKATCFPVTSMRGATFDKQLEMQIGEAIGEEVLEFGGNLFAGVCVNLPYHPGGGRAQETYGEDSCLLGEMGAALVKGIQENGVIACIKHFAFNSMENSRFDVNISCDKKTEREVFLPHFKKCIDAGAGAVMTAYNSYAGIMCGQHSYLLREVLKGEWGFDGFTMCDFNWGIKDGICAVESGLDMEMPNTHYYGRNLIEAVHNGTLQQSVIDEAAVRILRTLLAHDVLIRKNFKKQRHRQYHINLALQCAREGITLLRNENHTLPLVNRRKGKLLVLGRLADKENTGDRGSSQVYAPYVITMLQGIRNAAMGTEVIYYTGKSAAHCKRLAREADHVVIVAGNDYHDEGEYVMADENNSHAAYFGGDRQSGMGLKEEECAMIHAVATVRRDAVVVLMGGSTILMSEWYEETGAIVLAYYPGMEGGNALGELLFGKINPSGKLPFVIPQKEEDLPDIQWNTRQQRYGYDHGYTLLQKKRVQPLYPFGYGLSYTSFTFGIKACQVERGILSVNVQIQNCGEMDGAEVLQMYIGQGKSTGEYPQYRLRAFERILLEKGESKEVILSCEIQDLEYGGDTTQAFQAAVLEYQLYIGTSSALEDLKNRRIQIPYNPC